MNHAALNALIADLYAQIVTLQERIQELEAEAKPDDELTPDELRVGQVPSP